MESFVEDLGNVTLALEATEKRVRRESPKEPRALVRAFRSSLDETIAIVRVFSDGFHTARTEYKTRDRSKSADEVTRLAASPQQGMSAAFRLFTLFSISELELFTRDFANWWLTPAEISKFKRSATCRRYVRHLSPDPAIAKDQIITWLKPSAPPKPPTWPTRIQRVFRCRLDKRLSETMVTLILWRNEFSHLGQRRYRIDWMTTDFSESMIAWFFASTILSIRLGEASFRRLL
ncbi:hypothetical protein LZC95_48915 [Pendulispora brunnea]|uniref:Uncharacterized protein n=1 Tax=Pendulispora brunnea TaxID=2905690 RepID=A0ABZ2KDA1_9BACT